MGKSQKSETSHQLTREGTVDYLRRLADRLEGEEFDLEETVLELDDEVKVKETIKDKGSKFSIKIKIKLAGFDPAREDLARLEEPREGDGDSGDAPLTESGEGDLGAAGPEEPEPKPQPRSEKTAPPRRPSYKSLKKKMETNLKAIRTALREEGLPEQGLAEEFLAQCRLLVTFPTKGEAYFEEFEKATDTLAQAWKERNQAAMEESLAEMGRVRRNCHRRFK